jgi:cytochrome c oxidase subunit II
LYIPAFRLKHDVVPGDEETMWFNAGKLGTYDILCAEYCGQLHSYMLSTIKVVSRDDYDKWVESVPDTSDEHPGLTLMKQNACFSCHTQDGTRLVGPSFKGILGKQEDVIVDGVEKTITVDRDYIIQSIKDPNAEIVKTYQPGLMTNYSTILSDEQINHIVDYLETVK